MSEQRDDRYGRNERGGFRGEDEQDWRRGEERGRERERSRGFDRSGSGERSGSEQYGGPDESRYGASGEHGWRGEHGGRQRLGGHMEDYGRERDYRDYGRAQPGGAYEHAGERGYRHGGGYGGYGEQPGEAGGGFGSGRSYAAEPGWGPDYGNEARGNRAYEGQGGFPGSYGAQHGGYAREGGGYRHGGQGQYGQGFGEAGRTYGEHGSGQSRTGYGSEDRQRRQARGPKGYQRSDERLKEDICERLMAADHIDAAEVTVEVKSGKVTLEGSVPQRRMKHAIEDLVDDCIGVQDIDNKLRVAQLQQTRSETRTSIGTGAQGSSGSTGRS